MMIAVSLLAAGCALIANYPNAAAVALVVGCVWGIEALIVAKSGRKLSRSTSWALPLITLTVALALLAALSLT
jgi:hypothetical protein